MTDRRFDFDAVFTGDLLLEIRLYLDEIENELLPGLSGRCPIGDNESARFGTCPKHNPMEVQPWMSGIPDLLRMVMYGFLRQYLYALNPDTQGMVLFHT